MKTESIRVRGLLAAGLVAMAASRVTGGQAEDKGEAADLVVTSAKIWTGNEKTPEAEAVAVRDGRIVAVGTEAEVKPRIGPDTRVIDAKGRRIIPGITDAHTHVISAGSLSRQLYLREAKDRADFVRQVEEKARELGPSKWILGGRWSVDSWTDPSPPRKEWVDAVTPNNPLFLSRMDGHMALANSAALKIAGINKNGPPDPEGGRIDRDPKTREPTGLLRDDAMELVSKHIPEPDEAELDAAFATAMNQAHRWGITMVHDMSEWRHIETFRRAADRGKLTLRVYSFYYSEDWDEGLSRVKAFGPGNDWLRIGGFKGFMDGSLGSRTAYMAEPFCDNPPEQKGWHGLLVAMADPPQEMLARCKMADRAGMQTAVHSIGDQANHILLDIYAQVRVENGPRDRRQRIEHAQHLLVKDIPRFERQGVIASMQPYHKADDGRWAEAALGKERLAGTYAFASLLKTGATVCFGSDWPVVTCNPFVGMATAVTGRTSDGKVWIPSQSISVEQALRGYTMGGAKACFMEDRLGSIEVGKWADMVVLDRDLLSMPADRIERVEPVMTIVGGKVVWDKSQ
jgi:predicted amidohydrolase YtcJ